MAIDRRIKKANASKVPIGCDFTWIGWMSMVIERIRDRTEIKKATNTDTLKQKMGQWVKVSKVGKTSKVGVKKKWFPFRDNISLFA